MSSAAIISAAVIAVIACACFGAIVLFAARIDGKRQAMRARGLHPTTTKSGEVEALETQQFETQQQKNH